MRRLAHKYTNLEDLSADRDSVAWYWRLTALLASWMILGGYLILPAAYDEDPHLRFSKGALIIIIVAVMTTGYSFTALLFFAVSSWVFHAESVFLPALSASALGLLTICWSFASSSRFVWNSAAIASTVVSIGSCLIYGFLLVWTNRRIMQVRNRGNRSLSTYSDNSYYRNFIANMYPSMRKNPEGIPLTEDERINQQMAMLLMKNESGPSPDASSSTFRIDLPEEREHELDSAVSQAQAQAQAQAQVQAQAQAQAQAHYLTQLQNSQVNNRHSNQSMHSQYENVASPLSIVATPHPFKAASNPSPLTAPPASSPRAPRSISIQDYYQHMRSGSGSVSVPVPDALQHLQPTPPTAAGGWERAEPNRSRAGSVLTVDDASIRGRSLGREGDRSSRAVSREERRREIELGAI